MNTPGFSINYPLFALKTGSSYVGYDLSSTQPKRPGYGIPVFTTEVNVVAYLSHTKMQARIVRLDRSGVFRQLLRAIRDAGTFILFDPLPDARGNLRSDQVYPAAVVLERFLPEPGFGWDYPVYVLGLGKGYACVTGEHAGQVTKWLVVFTDSDLAERAVEAATDHVIAVPVPDREAFARIVRSLGPDGGGVVFDPPDPRRGGSVRSAMLRPRLLANLGMNTEI